jgi:transposase-like protein
VLAKGKGVVGITPEGKRTVLGTSVSLGEAEVHWRAFMTSLVKRGLHGVELMVADDHAGLRAAREAVFTGVPWQRCQFHLAQNALHHVPKVAMRRVVASSPRICVPSSTRRIAPTPNATSKP